MITKYDNYIFEFKSEDIELILTGLQDYFTIGFEIELEILPEILKGLRDVPRYESVTMYPSRQNRKMMEDFKRCFPNFYNKYKDRISFHDDETIVYGLEIVNKIFNNVKEAIQYIEDFFMDYEDQKHWRFTHRTSLHVNIGNYEKSPINMAKGVIMISDKEKTGFVFKGIENRIVNYCSSIKQKLIEIFTRQPNRILLSSTKIDDIEKIINNEILELYNYSSAKHYGVIFKKDYVEFRYVGGEKVNEKIMRDKILYFCYLVYLMSSEYRNKEYVRKLFSFINKLR